MHGLEGIKAMNEDPKGYHASREPQHYGHHTSPEETQRFHGERVENRQRMNHADADDNVTEQMLNSIFGAPKGEKTDIDGLLTRLNERHQNRRAKSGAAIVNGLIGAIIIEELLRKAVSVDKQRKHETSHMDRLDTSSMFDEPPFIRFWKSLNERRAQEGKDEALYAEAKEAFTGGPTPTGTLTFVGKEWDGIRAVPGKPVERLGGTRPTYHGEYRMVTDDGTIWLKVVNNNDLPIAYALPEAALIAAKDIRDVDVPKAMR